MAVVTIADENRQITDAGEIRAFLEPFGLWYETWPLEERVDPNAEPEEILKAYDPEIQTLMARGGYVTADVINLTPNTENLEVLLQKFSKEHTHTEDEVRFILKGRGVFHIHPPGGPVFAIQVDAGDMINVPEGTRHWFDLCQDRQIRAIRLFQDMTGWTPHYVDDNVDGKYVPVCMGPSDLAAEHGGQAGLQL